MLKNPFAFLIALVLLAAALIYVSHFRANSFFKTQVWGGWLQGLIFGPLLFMGLEILMTNHWTWPNLGAGCVWGLFVLFVIFLQDYETLVPSSQAGFHTWMSYLGFDRGRRFLEAWWIFCFFSFFVYQASQKHWLIWISSAFILAFFSFRFLKNLRNLSTPAGSQVVTLRLEGYQLFILAVTLWAFEEICYSLFKSIFSLWSQSV